jgi:hypothetical protein
MKSSWADSRVSRVRAQRRARRDRPLRPACGGPPRLTCRRSLPPRGSFDSS